MQKKQSAESKQLSAEEIKNRQYWYKGQIRKSHYIFDKEKLWNLPGKQQIKKFNSLIKEGIIKETISSKITVALNEKNLELQKKQSTAPKQFSVEEIKNKQYWYKGQIRRSHYIFDKEKLWMLSGKEQIKKFNSLIEKGTIKEATSSEITAALNQKKLEIQKKQPAEPKQLSAEEIKNKQYWYKGQIHKSRYIFDKEKLWNLSGKEQIKKFNSLIEKGIIKEAVSNNTEEILHKNVAPHHEQVEQIVTESPTLLKPEEVAKLQEDPILNNLKSNPSNKDLPLMNQRNQDDRLLALMNRYSDMQRQTKILEHEPKQQQVYSNFRMTGCWRCKKRINTDNNLKCPKCKWMICSCGACSLECFKHKLSILARK